jgi:hypothetical protein
MAKISTSDSGYADYVACALAKRARFAESVPAESFIDSPQQLRQACRVLFAAKETCETYESIVRYA